MVVVNSMAYIFHNKIVLLIIVTDLCHNKQPGEMWYIKDKFLMYTIDF